MREAYVEISSVDPKYIGMKNSTDEKNLWKWCCCVFVLMMKPCWASALLSNGRDSQPDTFQQIALVMEQVSSSTLNSVKV